MAIKKMILLAGCDKTGKSTLSRGMVEVLERAHSNDGTPVNVYYEHGEATKSVEQAIEKGKERLAHFHKLLASPDEYIVVLDRFNVPDEWVYYPVFSGELFTAEQLREYQLLEDEFWSFNPTVIHLQADVNDIAERFAADDEELVKPEQIADIMNRYRLYFLDRLPEHIVRHQLYSSNSTPRSVLISAMNYIGYDTLGNRLTYGNNR